MGYHLAKIKKGTPGKTSKIREEVEEFLDAHEQGIKIMELVELSDIIGAISLYLSNKYPQITLIDLQQMSEATKRAFAEGERKGEHK